MSNNNDEVKESQPGLVWNVLEAMGWRGYKSENLNNIFFENKIICILMEAYICCCLCSLSHFWGKTEIMSLCVGL